jgi:hypothetical protein
MSTPDTEFDTMYGSKYFSASDLNGGRKRLQIGKVEIAELREKDGSTKRKFVIWFNGEEKALVCNKTNANALAHAFGKDRRNWVGAFVELYSEMTGLGKPGVRLKPLRGGPTAPTTPSNPLLDLDPPQWEPVPDDFR